MFNSPEALYEREWIFNKADRSAPPRFGVCFSGGGNRSAAFSIGVLRALQAKDLLKKIDVISAVSGGSYALSWFLLQPFYHRASVENPGAMIGRIQEEMFDLGGPFQRYLVENAKPLGASGLISLFLQVAISFPIDFVLFNTLRILSLLLSWGNGASKAANLLNAQSISRKAYREGIQRTYQVFPDSLNKLPENKLSFSEETFIASQLMDLTRFHIKPVSFPVFAKFTQRAGLPSFVFNTTVRPPQPDANTPLGLRIFELNSMGLGSDSCGYLEWAETEGFGWEPGDPIKKGWMFRNVKRRDGGFGVTSPYATIRCLNVASAISGAALSGTNIEERKTRRLLKFLNLGLEYVAPNPADRKRLVRLSDGGHSENLGLYALLRRRCRSILVVDAEHDASYAFGAYRKVKKAAQKELNIQINIPGIEKITSGTGRFDAARPIQEGTTTFDEGHQGKIYYLKLSMHPDLLDDQADVINAYAKKHPQFPQESTLDQYFQPAQFKAYRELGYTIAQTLSSDAAS